MTIAIHGLGKMGMQIAHKLQQAGHTVIAHNRSQGPIDQAAAFGATPAVTKDDVLKAFGDESPVIWLMLPDDITGQQIDEWLKLVPNDSLIIDGGNSDFRLSQGHAEQVAEQHVQWLDVGTSGGIMGLEGGFCMMAGGDAAAYERLMPVLDSLAAPHGGHHHMGPAGSGHYVKMVHNAIEYGMMQSLAEGYHVLKAGPYDSLDLAAIADLWQQGSIVQSLLNRLAAGVLRDNPAMDGIDGKVHESGEARWTLEVAKDRHIPMPAIQAAMDVRLRSQQGDIDYSTRLLAALRHAFGGHDINPAN